MERVLKVLATVASVVAVGAMNAGRVSGGQGAWETTLQASSIKGNPVSLDAICRS